jgi:hypothetical protein
MAACSTDSKSSNLNYWCLVGSCGLFTLCYADNNEEAVESATPKKDRISSDKLNGQGPSMKLQGYGVDYIHHRYNTLISRRLQQLAILDLSSAICHSYTVYGNTYFWI